MVLVVDIAVLVRTDYIVRYPIYRMTLESLHSPMPGRQHTPLERIQSHVRRPLRIRLRARTSSDIKCNLLMAVGPYNEH